MQRQCYVAIIFDKTVIGAQKMSHDYWSRDLFFCNKRLVPGQQGILGEEQLKGMYHSPPQEKKNSMIYFYMFEIKLL